MSGPMSGIRVVELGVWVAGPAASAILADWGAEVVKIEAANGDPYRWVYAAARGGQAPLNAPFEMDNRGKRSLALDVGSTGGREVILRLVERADVFVTNMRLKALERWGLGYDSLTAVNSRLVYAEVTGYGRSGAERDRPSYDFGAFWSRSGIAASLAPPNGMPPAQRGGMGDHCTAMAATAGIAAALFERERTGRGQLVSTSLLRAGIYVLGWDTSMALRAGVPLPLGVDRAGARNPLFNSYRDRDGRWFWLIGLEGDRHWPNLARAVGRPEWLDDERYRSLVTRAGHARELVAALDELFATRPLADWAEVFDREDVWWAPVLTSGEVVQDPQAAASGAFVDAPVPEGTARVVASPVDFSDSAWAPSGPSPEVGQHTEEVLLELGYDWDRIIELKESGVIP